MMENKVNDHRSALALLKTVPHQLHEAHVAIDADLAGRFGAAGTVVRHERQVFNHILTLKEGLALLVQ